MWFFFFLFVFGTSYASFDFMGGQSDVENYVQKKILGSCFGDSFVKTWEDSLKISTEKCFSEGSLGEMPSLANVLESDIIQKHLSKLNIRPSYPYTSLLHPQKGPQINLLNDVQLSQDLPNFARPGYHVMNRHPSPVSAPNNPLLLLPFSGQQSIRNKQDILSYFSNPEQHNLKAEPNLLSLLEKSELGGFQKRQSAIPMMWLPDSAQSFQRNRNRYDSYSWRRRGKALRPEHRGGNFELNLPYQPNETPWEINNVRKELADRISNITCVLKSMELLDMNNIPNYESNKNLIQHLDIPDQFRNSLLKIHEFCREFSMCVPVHKLTNIFYREIGYSLVFLKCMKRKVIKACIARDIDESKPESNLPEDLTLQSEKLFFNSVLNKDRRSYATRSLSLFEKTPENVAGHMKDLFSMNDEVGFGF